MAQIINKPEVGLKVVVELNEAEVRALDALTGYDIEQTIACFYQTMGRHYLEPHASALRSFMCAMHNVLPGYLEALNKARGVFNQANNPALKESISEMVEKAGSPHLAKGQKA